ncbi:MAG: hypothetical protein V3T86_01515 [Planctomycetota bacterium]
MSTAQLFIVAFALLTFGVWQFGITGYWRLSPVFAYKNDLLGDAHQAHLSSIRRRFGSTWTTPLVLTALCFALTPWWLWSRIDADGFVRPIVLLSTAVVTWRAVTIDVDLATGRTFLFERVLMALACAGVWIHPAFLVIVLHTGLTWLRSYDHHQHLPIRMMLMFLACVGAVPVLGVLGRVRQTAPVFDLTVPVLFLFLVVCASHFVVPGFGKLRLGARWYTWIRDNRIDSMPVSAYLWGWLRFLPERVVIRTVRFIRPFAPLLQALSAVIEVGSALILFDRRLCLVLLAAFAAFHLMVFLLSGILFWQFVIVEALLFAVVFRLPAELAADLFGLQTGFLGIALLLVFPLRGKLWRPHKLSWWDTPFACRVHYEVKGRESGTWYGLYADFMCPHERTFGQSYGDFLSDEKRLNGHLGETDDRSCFDAIHAVGDDLSGISRAKENLGTSRYDRELVAKHDRYFTAFLHNFNAGCRKRVCPVWLKAPGGQLFYWGTLPRFTGQEPIEKLIVRYREQYFDGERIHPVTDKIVREYSPHQPGA